MRNKSSAFRSAFFKSTILIVIQSYSLTVLSQQPHDYQLFRQDATYFYNEITWSSQVVAVKLDSSAQTEEGTEWFNFNSFYNNRLIPYECYKPDGPSWIGWKMLVKPNGDNVLYGYNNHFSILIEDTVLIKTNALPGDSWCYIHANVDIGPDTMATVTRCGIKTFLGITDSIKVIDLGEDSIILSKEHGLVRALNFRDYLPFYNIDKFKLAGITSGDTITGKHLLTRGEIYNYEAGDIFHIESLFGNIVHSNIYDIYEVLAKTYSDNLDTVFYQLSNIRWYEIPGGTSDPEYDTINEAYTDLDSFVTGGYFPNEVIWDPDEDEFYEMWMYYGEQYLNGRPMIDDPYETFSAPEPPDSCYSLMEKSSYYSYIEGCGDFMNLYDEYDFCAPCEILKYFKKGNEEWGTPFTILTGISEFEQLDARIYPVPAGDYVMIEVNEPEIDDFLKITISDISGRNLAEKSVLPGQMPYRLDISLLNKGIYLLVISSGERQAVRKIVH